VMSADSDAGKYCRMAFKTLEKTNSISWRMSITSTAHQTNQPGRTSRGHFSPFTSGIPLTNAASLRGFTDGGGALSRLLLHRSETQPNLTPLGKCQTHPPLPYQTNQHSQRRAYSAVTLCLCLPKPRRLLTNVWALLLLLIMRGFSYKLQKGESRSCSDRQDVRGSVHLSSQNAG
jgi:hypothetical protein